MKHAFILRPPSTFHVPPGVGLSDVDMTPGKATVTMPPKGGPWDSPDPSTVTVRHLGTAVLSRPLTEFEQRQMDVFPVLE